MNPQKRQIIMVLGATVLCMVLSLVLVLAVGPLTHAADNDPVIVELNELGDYTYTGSAGNYQIRAISTAGRNKINAAGSNYEIHLNFPEGVISTPSYASNTYSDNPFYTYRTKITSVTFPDGFTTLGAYFFYSGTALSSVDLSQTEVTALDNFTFSNCKKLIDVKLPVCLTAIGAQVFNGCSALTHLDLSQTQVTTIGTYAFYNCAALMQIQFPDTLISIGSAAFSNCAALTSVDLSQTQITLIDNEVFKDCKALTQIKLPASLVTCKYLSFNNCTALTEVNYSGTIDQWVQIDFDNTQNNNPVYYAKKLTIQGEDLTEIKASDLVSATQINFAAFVNCSSLISVDLPATITAIGWDAFNSCASLSYVDLSKTMVTELSYREFSGCRQLQIVKLPAGMTNISGTSGSRVFEYCNNVVLVCPNAAVYREYKQNIPHYSYYYTYPIGLQINLTDHEQKQSVYAEKMLAGERFTDWHYVDGQWVQESDHVLAALPGLPKGYIWVDDNGKELTVERIQTLLTQAQNDDEVVVINAHASSDGETGTDPEAPTVVTAPTADTRQFVYNGQPQTYVPNGFDAGTMTIANNTRTGVGSQTVTVALRDKTNYVWSTGGTDDLKFTFTIAADPDNPDPNDPNRPGTGDGGDDNQDDPNERPGQNPEDPSETDPNNPNNPNQPGQGGDNQGGDNQGGDNAGDNAGDNTQPDAPVKIAAPTASRQNFVYTGNYQTYIPVGYDPNTMTIEGNLQSAVGRYTVTVRPKTNYVFTDGTNTVTFNFVIEKADIIVRKNGDEWFDERIDGGDLADDLEISFLTVENGNYKYIMTADGCRLVIEFDVNLYRADQSVVPQYTTDRVPTIAKDTAAGRYVIYYRITDPAGNHHELQGTWRVEIADKEAYLIVIFHRVLTVTYGMDYLAQLNAKIFDENEAYITVYEYIGDDAYEMALSAFAELVDVGVITKNPNSYGFQNAGKYDIYFQYKKDVEGNRTIIYKLTNNGANTNEDKLEIKPAELSINWGKMEYVYAEGASYDIVAELTGHTMFAERYALSLQFIIRNVNGQIVDTITEVGSYSIEAVLVDDYHNFVIADGARTRILVVKEAERGFLGLPMWVWIGIGVLLAVFVLWLLAVLASLARGRGDKK